MTEVKCGNQSWGECVTLKESMEKSITVCENDEENESEGRSGGCGGNKKPLCVCDVQITS